eukprot:3686323-Pleurochrysis_carterae.AAC.4
MSVLTSNAHLWAVQICVFYHSTDDFSPTLCGLPISILSASAARSVPRAEPHAYASANVLCLLWWSQESDFQANDGAGDSTRAGGALATCAASHSVRGLGLGLLDISMGRLGGLASAMVGCVESWGHDV